MGSPRGQFTGNTMSVFRYGKWRWTAAGGSGQDRGLESTRAGAGPVHGGAVTQLPFRSATELAAAIRAREISSTGLLDCYLDRIERRT